MKTKSKSSDTRTLFVKFNSSGPKKITIPAGCKVTFGPLCPGSKNAQHNSEGATALRIYNGVTQIACFVKVESFYETDSVTCITKQSKKAVKVQQYEEGGVTKDRSVAVEVTEWKDELVESESSDAVNTFAALRDSQDKAS